MNARTATIRTARTIVSVSSLRCSRSSSVARTRPDSRATPDPLPDGTQPRIFVASTAVCQAPATIPITSNPGRMRRPARRAGGTGPAGAPRGRRLPRRPQGESHRSGQCSDHEERGSRSRAVPEPPLDQKDDEERRQAGERDERRDGKPERVEEREVHPARMDEQRSTDGRAEERPEARPRPWGERREGSRTPRRSPRRGLPCRPRAGRCRQP